MMYEWLHGSFFLFLSLFPHFFSSLYLFFGCHFRVPWSLSSATSLCFDNCPVDHTSDLHSLELRRTHCLLDLMALQTIEDLC